MKIYPFTLLIILWCFSIVVISYIISILEKLPNSYNDKAYLDSVWIMIVLQTTIGYGDLAPTTQISRIFGALGCILGMASLSMIVHSFRITMRLEDNNEMVVYKHLLLQDKYYSDMNVSSGKLIKSFLLYVVKRKLEKRGHVY